jgi:glycosyltransferase involved in cell wall biosynthesis
VFCPGGDAAALFESAGAPVHVGTIATFSHVVTCTYTGLRWAMVAREAARAVPHVRAIARRIRSEHAALVHLNEGNLLLAALVARLCGTPVVCHFRGMLAEGHFGLRRRLIRTWLSRCCEAVIAIDSGVATPLSGLPNLRIVHNSVDLALFGRADGAALRHELGLSMAAPVAGMVGRVRRDEGSFDFLDAAARLQERLPDARFLLIGGGTRPPAFFRTARGRLLLAAGIIRDDLADAQSHAARLALTNTRFVPFRRDVAAVYGALNVVVTGGEAGIGRQALEAAAAGRPIVAAARQSVPDLVAEGQTGHLVPPGDAAALADCLHSLLTDRERSTAMGALARQVAAERFDPAANAARIMAIYDQLLGMRPPKESHAAT